MLFRFLFSTRFDREAGFLSQCRRICLWVAVHGVRGCGGRAVWGGPYRAPFIPTQLWLISWFSWLPFGLQRAPSIDAAPGATAHANPMLDVSRRLAPSDRTEGARPCNGCRTRGLKAHCADRARLLCKQHTRMLLRHHSERRGLRANTALSGRLGLVFVLRLEGVCFCPMPICS